MSTLRSLFFIEARLQFSISSQHIAGVSNTLADCLSRNQLENFYAKFPSAHCHSSVVPSSLLQWLLDSNIDWTSPHWMKQFSILFSRNSPVYPQDLPSSIEKNCNILLYLSLFQCQSLYCVILPLT